MDKKKQGGNNKNRMRKQPTETSQVDCPMVSFMQCLLQQNQIDGLVSDNALTHVSTAVPASDSSHSRNSASMPRRWAGLCGHEEEAASPSFPKRRVSFEGTRLATTSLMDQLEVAESIVREKPRLVAK